MSNREVSRVLVLSTGHLPADVYSSLHNLIEKLEVAGFARPEGLMINEASATNELWGDSFYRPLDAVLTLARQGRCDWVMLDCDGPKDTALRLYDW